MKVAKQIRSFAKTPIWGCNINYSLITPEYPTEKSVLLSALMIRLYKINSAKRKQGEPLIVHEAIVRAILLGAIDLLLNNNPPT